MESKWLRPITTRRYVHCPKAERMYTLWSEGKIIFGEQTESFNGEKYWDEVLCSGIWFVDKNKNQFDFKKTVNHFRKDGIPVHSVEHNMDGIKVYIEAISNVDRKPTCFIKVTLKNATKDTKTTKLGFYVRSGLEGTLVYGAPDNYTSYNPDIKVWKEHKSNWKNENGIIKYGKEFITVKTCFPFAFDNNNGYGEFQITLGTDEEKEIYLSLGKGDAADFDYETEKTKTIKYWGNELAKLNLLPEKVKNDEKVLSIVRCLTAQILQNFCYYPGWDYMVLRQGGLQRRIWLWEAMCALKVLPTIGDYDDYVDEIVRFYFERLQQDNGEVVTLGEPWANATASAISTLVPLALKKGKAYFDKYREKAYKAYTWIKETRALSSTMDNMVDGFFPSMQGSDAKVIFQNWWFTDTVNVYALKDLYNLFKHFSDNRSGEIKAEYEDYLAVYKKYFEIAKENCKDKEYLYVPLSPNGDTEEFRKSFAFDGLIFATGNLMAKTEQDIERIYKLYDLEGRVDHEHGMMCVRMRDGASVSNPPEPHIWYVGSTEYSLYYLYKELSNTEKMKACLESTYKFSMTDEQYMVERFQDNDPYFAPWSPNVSENGRFIEMLCDYLK